MGSETQRWIDSVSGNYGTASGLYGQGPVQSYTRPLSAARIAALTEAYSNPSQGKAIVDPYGKLLGYENEGNLINQRAQDRLFAQLTGATAQQLLGPLAGDKNTTFLRPEQLQELLSFRKQYAPESMSSALQAPGGAGFLPQTDVGMKKAVDPKLIGFLAGGLLLLLLLMR